MMWSEKYIGWQSRTHDQDASCWDFVVFVMQDNFGIALPAYRPTTDESMKKIVAEEQLANWRPVPCAQEGDLALIKVKGRRYHIGIMINEHVMLHHRSPQLGAVLDSLKNGLWRNVLEGFYRHASR